MPELSGRFSRGRGNALVYCIAALAPLIGFVALAVDFAFVQCSRAQLQAAADGASMAAAEALPLGIAAVRQRAAALLAEQTVAGRAIPFDPATDLTVGQFDSDTQTFTPAADGDAVRISLQSYRSRGGGVPLTFCRAFGRDNFDIAARSIARRLDPSEHEYFGLDSFAARGVLYAAGYPAGSDVHIASNGPVTLNLLGLIGITSVHGDVRPGPSKSIAYPAIGSTQITGTRAPLVKPCKLPPIAAGAGSTNDNALLPGGALVNGDFLAVGLIDVPSGVYRVDDFRILAGATLRLHGPTTFFVTGNVTVLGSVIFPGSDVTALKLRVIGSEPVTLAAAAILAVDLYAPKSAVTIAAGLVIGGRVIGQSIDVLGSAILIADTRLPPVSEGVELVQICR